MPRVRLSEPFVGKNAFCTDGMHSVLGAARGEVRDSCKGENLLLASRQDLLRLSMDLQPRLRVMRSSAGTVTVAGVAFAKFTL